MINWKRTIRCFLVIGAFWGGSQTANAATVTVLDMDTDPMYEEGWGLYRVNSRHFVSDGILTVYAPAFHEIVAPSSIWQDAVDNSSGWVIETRMRRDPSSIGTPGIWINDNVNLFIALFDPEGLRLTDAFFGGAALVDTSAFHTYRFEGEVDTLDVFVDGSLARHFESSRLSGGTFTLMFGDLNDGLGGTSISEWDYFSVTTFDKPSEVPIPASVYLLGSGLLTLLGLSTKRNAA